MADIRLAVVGGVLFCGLVLILYIILYFPDTTHTDDAVEDLWTSKNTVKYWNDFEYTTEPPEAESKFATVAKVIEDMGASFLVLLAVLCVAAGLACLTFACCCCAA